MGPNSKILASRSSSGLGRTNGGGLARAVGVYGCLRDLREPEVRGRASDGATAATDMVFEREHQSGCDRRDRMMRHMRFFSISMGAVNNSIFNS